MGAWNTKAFGNDTALDWLAVLEKSGNSYIKETLEKITRTTYPSAFEAEECIAAATLVSVALKEPIRGIPKQAKEWIEEHGYVPKQADLELASNAIIKVTTHSELLELWEESGNSKKWIDSVNEIVESIDNIDISSIPLRAPKARPIPRVLWKLVEHPELFTNPVIREKIQKKLRTMKNISEASEETNWETPLCLMIRNRLFQEVEDLLELGANPNSIGTTGSALSQACKINNLHLAELLISKGAEIVTQSFDYYPEEGGDACKHVNVSAPLVTAVTCAANPTIQFLIEHGADPHMVDKNGKNLIHFAAEAGNFEAIKLLVRLGVDVNHQTKFLCDTPCNDAFPNIEIMKFLIDKGANPDIPNKTVGNVMDKAIFFGDEKVKLFLEKIGVRQANPHTMYQSLGGK